MIGDTIAQDVFGIAVLGIIVVAVYLRYKHWTWREGFEELKGLLDGK